MTDMGRYPSEVRAIADEILDYLSGENYPNAKRMLDILGLDGLANMSSDDCKAAIKLIQQAPSARHKKIERMEGRQFYELLVKARYIALLGADLIAVASDFEMVPGMSYRRAAGFSAENALRLRPPTLKEILPPSAQQGY